jgi:predicted aldo/keto reductase-like oxidoreductase
MLDKKAQAEMHQYVQNLKKCLKKCPQKIAIPDELEKVHSILAKRGRISDYYEVS